MKIPAFKAIRFCFHHFISSEFIPFIGSATMQLQKYVRAFEQWKQVKNRTKTHPFNKEKKSNTIHMNRKRLNGKTIQHRNIVCNGKSICHIAFEFDLITFTVFLLFHLDKRREAERERESEKNCAFSLRQQVSFQRSHYKALLKKNFMEQFPFILREMRRKKQIMLRASREIQKKKHTQNNNNWQLTLFIALSFTIVRVRVSREITLLTMCESFEEDKKKKKKFRPESVVLSLLLIF